MELLKRGTIVIAAVFVLMMACPASSVEARNYAVNDVISLSSGDAQQREFTLDGALSIPSFEPFAGYVVIATGSDNETVGDLSITLSADAEIEFGAYMDYGLLGFGYSLDEGPIVVYETATTPFSVEKTVAINSMFGFVYVGGFIKDVSSRNDVKLPAQFTISFTLE